MLDRFSAWAEIDLDAIVHNVQGFKRLLGEQVAIMAVVKANAYGHGMEQVARAALAAGATWLTVSRLDEGIALRQAGLDAPILLMGFVACSAAPLVVQYGLTPTLADWSLAQALSAAANRLGRLLPVHVKVDTGMNRFGLAPEETLDFMRALVRLPGLVLQGLYTHFASADAADGSYTRRQLACFKQVLAALEANGIRVPVRHAANSAAALTLPEARLDAVRLGIAMYGLRPSTEVEPAIPLRPALTLKGRVAQVRVLPPGSSISYGRTYTTSQTTPVALIACGYGDGYSRLCSNRGAVLVRGRRAPIRGRVCMDQLVVEVSGIAGVRPGDEAVLIGRQGDQEISAEEVAGWAETINYEVVTQLLPRLPRVYLRQGQIVAISGLPILESEAPGTF